MNCRLFTGIVHAAHLGVVLLPNDDGLAYAVLDRTGVLFEGTLLFSPHHVRVGVREDLSVLVGFGNLRLISGEFRSVDSREPIQILHDNHDIFNSDKVLDFDIASNGSSFVVHEPVPGRTTRLIIRDFDTGKESHYDLGTRLTPSNAYEVDHVLSYTMGETEIIFEPSPPDAMGLGTYWFYPVRKVEVHEISINAGISALLASSTEGYFTEYLTESDQGEQGLHHAIYRRAKNTINGEMKVLWKRELSLYNFSGRMSLSVNGKWLELSGWGLEILDTHTGES